MAADGPGHGHGREALAALDSALAKRPHADPDLFAAATRHMAAFRDALIDAGRGAAPDGARQARLDTANAVLGMVLAGRFPLGSVPWEEIGKARGWLAGAVDGG